MTDETNIRLEATAAVIAPLFTSLEALEHISRHLHPPELGVLVESTSDVPVPLLEAIASFSALEWPEQFAEFSELITSASTHVLEAFNGLAEAARGSEGPLKAYRAIRAGTRALESLYQLAPIFPPVSRFFIEPSFREDAALADRLAGLGSEGEGRGITHFQNARESRGGYSIYVPEYYEETHKYPVIFALHGGSGHGADFLWTWLREARTHGAIVVSPTSEGRTWALQEPDVDTPRLESILDGLRTNWNIDSTRLLLTGMSDGGTFTYLSGLRPESPFTHLAPSSASFHGSLLRVSTAERLADLPIYVMHGQLDWMFPVDFARNASAALTQAGARVVLRDIPDLSHTYPRDENPKIMDWFMG